MKCIILFCNISYVFIDEPSFIFFGTAIVVYNPDFLKELENKLKRKIFLMCDKNILF